MWFCIWGRYKTYIVFLNRKSRCHIIDPYQMQKINTCFIYQRFYQFCKDILRHQYELIKSSQTFFALTKNSLESGIHHSMRSGKDLQFYYKAPTCIVFYPALEAAPGNHDLVRCSYWHWQLLEHPPASCSRGSSGRPGLVWTSGWDPLHNGRTLYLPISKRERDPTWLLAQASSKTSTSPLTTMQWLDYCVELYSNV